MFSLPEMIIAVLVPVVGLFSPPVRGHAQALLADAIPHTVWYAKTEATFSDVLAFVRQTSWAGIHLSRDGLQADCKRAGEDAGAPRVGLSHFKLVATFRGKGTFRAC